MTTAASSNHPAAVSSASRSEFVRVRGLRYHVRRWGDPGKPLAVLGHGWLDVSATFHDLVQPLLPHVQVLAPDWRGLGHTQWPQDGYWFPDYVADLDALIGHYAGDTPVDLVGHSMGAQILSLYAGLHPDRVRRFVCLDGLFLPDMPPDHAPRRLANWIATWPGGDGARRYPSFADLAERIRRQHPQLSAERALSIARCWSAEDGYGRIRLLADPRHRLEMPTLYRAAESMAFWQRITAPTLFVDAERSGFARRIDQTEIDTRRACFRDHRARTIVGAGHMLHFDQPEATGLAVADFLSTRL